MEIRMYCPKCNKVVEGRNEFFMGDESLICLECGEMFFSLEGYARKVAERLKECVGEKKEAEKEKENG